MLTCLKFSNLYSSLSRWALWEGWWNKSRHEAKTASLTQHAKDNTIVADSCREKLHLRERVKKTCRNSIPQWNKKFTYCSHSDSLQLSKSSWFFFSLRKIDSARKLIVWLIDEYDSYDCFTRVSSSKSSEPLLHVKRRKNDDLSPKNGPCSVWRERAKIYLQIYPCLNTRWICIKGDLSFFLFSLSLSAAP